MKNKSNFLKKATFNKFLLFAHIKFKHPVDAAYLKTLRHNLPTSKVQAHYTENKVLSIYYLVYTYRTSLGTLTSLHTRFPFVCLFFFFFFFAPLLLLFRKRNLIISDLSFTGAVFFCFRYSNAIASVRM